MNLGMASELDIDPERSVVSLPQSQITSRSVRRSDSCEAMRTWRTTAADGVMRLLSICR
jgi:hypothetical protein